MTPAGTTVRRVAIATLLAALFATSFVLRAKEPLSRSTLWLDRATRFEAALAAGDWAATQQSYHPGVTLMLVSGLALRAFDAAAGTPAAGALEWIFPASATELGRRVAVAVAGVAAVLAALHVLVAVVLRGLAGWAVALTATWLIALGPFELAAGRTLRVDALLSVLMLLSVLLLLLGLERRRGGLVAWSGLVAGLAGLTKTPAAGLAAFAALALAVQAPPGRRLRLCALWAAGALLPLVLWPALWVDPVGVLRNLGGAAAHHLLVSHDQPVFFAGRLFHASPPGALFYPVTLAFDASFVTLTLAVVGVGHYTLWRRRFRARLSPASFAWLAVYAVGFGVAMALAAKQVGGRYVLPVHLVLEVMAAVGWVGACDLALARLDVRRPRLVAAGATALVLALQGLVSLSYAPDVGMHHNALLGGNRTASAWVALTSENEGIGAVAEALAARPDAASLRVAAAARPGKHLGQYFAGERVPHGSESDYLLFDAPSVQRRIRPEEWEAAWEEARAGSPELVVAADDVELFWLYPGRPRSGAPAAAVVRRGWTGWVAVAWAWTALLAAGLAWILRSAPLSAANGMEAAPEAR